MFSNERLNQDQVNAYLERLAFSDNLNVSLDVLSQLLFAHLTHIPFDSIDVWGAGICPSLDINDIYNKIVVKGRGGYCFEQNTLFRVLLCTLGFDAYQVAAHVIPPDGSIQPPAHNVILCRLDGKKYLLDVGFGGPVPYEPMELAPGEYGIFTLQFAEGYYTLLRKEEDRLRPFIRFRDVPVTITDLIPLNFYISQYPESHFRHLIHVNQRKSDGSTYVINGNEFKIHKDGQTVSKNIESIDELKNILKSYYQIDPDFCLLRDSL